MRGNIGRNQRTGDRDSQNITVVNKSMSRVTAARDNTSVHWAIDRTHLVTPRSKACVCLVQWNFVEDHEREQTIHCGTI